MHTVLHFAFPTNYRCIAPLFLILCIAFSITFGSAFVQQEPKPKTYVYKTGGSCRIKADVLSTQGIRNELVTMPGTPHLFDNDMSKAETQAAFKKVLSLFAEHLKGRTATDHTRRFPSPRILERTCELGLTNYRICASN